MRCFKTTQIDTLMVKGRICIFKVYADTVKSRYLEVDGTVFYKFKWAEVQINLHFL